MQKIYRVLILFVVITPAHAEFDFDAYPASTFAEINARHADDLLTGSRNNGYTVSTETFKYHIPVSFNKAVITAWQTTLRVPDDFVNRYQREFKVVFDKHTYWIPVQEGLLPAMGAELQAGDRFELYIIVIGAIKNRLVFLTTEFKSGRAPD